MPGVAALGGFRRAVAEFSFTDLDVVFEAAALATARQALDWSGSTTSCDARHPTIRRAPILTRQHRDTRLNDRRPILSGGTVPAQSTMLEWTQLRASVNQR